MSEESAALPDLQVLGIEAQRAVGAARAEAQALGHPRIGTEHLLLGILRNEATEASRVLDEAGAGRAAVWSKVREAKRSVDGGTDPSPSEGTPRAARAVSRSVRFSHQRHNGPVTTEDLLIGVLDVEGTAGQVLRSLGVDLDELRAELDRTDATPSPEHAAAPVERALICPSCGEAVSQLTHRLLASTGPAGVHDVLVHACPACGVALDATPA